MQMKTFSKTTLLSLLAVPFLLTACGEGYELIKTDTMFPYGNERTAGSGYAYVLAKMLPKKEVKLETVQRDMQPEVVSTLPKTPIETTAPAAPASDPEPAVEPDKGDKLFLESGKK